MIKKVLRSILVAVLLLGLTPISTTAAPDPVNCTGYPEPRTHLQVHAWWQGDPVPAGHIAHVHSELCFPLGQRVSGPVELDIKIVLHDNPGTLFRYDSWIHDAGGAPATSLNHTCGLDETCEFWIHTTLTSQVNAPDGWYEYRPKARVRMSNGDVLLTSGGWPIYLDNGNPPMSGGFRTGLNDGRGITGRGWWDGHGYQNPVFVGPVADVMGGETVSGTWNTTLRLDAGSGGDPTTMSGAWLDNDWHHFDEDTTDGNGPRLLRVNGPYRGPLAIDTTQLTNGPHTLVLRVDSQRPEGRLTGLQYVRFVVANEGAPAPTPTEHPHPTPTPTVAPAPSPTPIVTPTPTPASDELAFLLARRDELRATLEAIEARIAELQGPQP